MTRKVIRAVGVVLLALSPAVSSATPKFGFFNLWGAPNNVDWGAPVPVQGLAMKHSDAEIGWTNVYNDNIIEAVQQGGLVELIPYVYTNNADDAKHMYEEHDVRRFVFGNEPELMPEGLEGYMYNLSGGPSGMGGYWYAHNYVGPETILIAGNNQDSGYAIDYMYNYDPSFAELNDMVGFHPYSNDENTGLSIGSVITVHNKMVYYGDGAKQMFLGEGWGPKRQLPNITRASHLLPATTTEIESLRNFVVNGYRNLTTPGGGYDPAWIYGALFFTLSDNWGYEGGVTYHHYNGGLIDLNGNPNYDLLLVFPGNNMTVRNCGFEHYTPGTPAGSVPFWSFRGGTSSSCYAVDASVRRGGARSGRIELSGTTEAYFAQTSVAGSVTVGEQYTFAAWVKTEDVDAGSYSGARVGVQFFNSSGGATSGVAWSSGRTGAGDWALMSVTGTAPSGSVKLRVFCDLNTASGRAWFDDCGVSNAASPHTGSIEGYVLNRKNNNAISGATVTVEPVGYMAISDSTGFFGFTGLPAGAYDLTATGALLSQTTIKRVAVAPGRTSIAGVHVIPRLVTSPRNVQVFNPAMGGMLRISWEPLSEAVSYCVWRSTDPGYFGPMIFDRITSTSVWDTSCSNDVTYYYHVAGVRANDEYMDTTGSNYPGFSTWSSAAPDIANVRAAVIAPGIVAISWDTVAPTTSRVQYGPTTSYGLWSAYDSTYVDEHSVTISGLAVGDYHFRARSTRSGKPDSYSLDYKFHMPVHEGSVVDVKSEPDGSVLGFSGIVSAVFAGCFYVVDVEGVSGIRVEYPPAGIAEGATVYVSGTVQTNAAGERFVDAASVGT